MLLENGYYFLVKKNPERKSYKIETNAIVSFVLKAIIKLAAMI